MPELTPPASCRLLLGLILAGTGAVGRGADADVTAAWERLGQHLANDALAGLRPQGAPADRERALAEAVVRMEIQPVTEASLKKVEQELTGLVQGDDEIAQVSAYLIGRLYQAHYFTPDYARAAAAYTALAEKSPGSYWAQLGLVKLALLKLYALPEPAGGVKARLAEAEALLPRVDKPELQRDLHLVLGRAELFQAQPLEVVLPHLLAADHIGGLTQLKRGELQLQIGELSRRAGQWAQARAYFQKFIAENEVDGRLATAKLRLAQIDQAQRAEGLHP